MKYLASATSRRGKMERTGKMCFSTDFRCFLPLNMLPYLYATNFLHDKTEKELHSYEIIKTAAHRSAGDRICAFFHVLRSRKHHFPAVSGDGIRQLVGAGVSLLLPGRHRDRHSGNLCIDPKRRRDLYHNHTDRQSPRRDHAVCYHPLHRALHRSPANRGYSAGNVHRTGIRRCVFMAYQRDLLSAGPAFDH